MTVVRTRSAAAGCLTLLLATLGGACHRGAVASSPAPSAAPQPAPFSTITLERKPCFGTCPVYLLTVTGDGSVTFDGRQHVDSARRVTAHLGADGIAALARLFDAQFFAFDSRYAYGEKNCAMYATDADVVITSIATPARTKTVEHDHGCAAAPAQLGEIERSIDEIVGTRRWIGH